jgi:hypothetical protein
VVLVILLGYIPGKADGIKDRLSQRKNNITVYCMTDGTI